MILDKKFRQNPVSNHGDERCRRTDRCVVIGMAWIMNYEL